MGKKIGVLLSGCGVYDGSEIHETVLTLLYLDQKGAETVCMAPNIPQRHVVNHITNEAMDEERNVLVESARIARGDVQDLKNVAVENLDALIIPGGFGAAKNLIDFAEKGPDATVNPEVARVLLEMVRAEKPVGALCIAPATLTKALSSLKPDVTIGNDGGTASAMSSMGGIHLNCTVDMIHVDEQNRLVSSPAYLLGPDI